MSWFSIYVITSGILTFLWFWYDMEHVHIKEAEDTIADITWNTGTRREHVRLLFYAMALLFGWIILPCELFSIFGEKRI